MEIEALDNYFGYTEKGSSFENEIRAGIATFLTMAYILVVNPAMLSLAGIPFDDALFATALAAFIGCMVMGLWANLPFALAPGMGLNAFFVFGVVFTMGIGWELALAAVFVEGIVFLIISLPQVGWRSAMINSIPKDLKIATGAGIGTFLAIIGLREMGWVVDHPATLVALGPTGSFGIDHGAMIAMVALLAIAVMLARGIKGAIIYGVMGASIVGWALGAYDPWLDNAAGLGTDGWVCIPLDDGGYLDPDCIYASAPALGDIFGFVGMPTESLGAFAGALGDIGSNLDTFILVMVAFLFVDIFDTAGTLYSVGRQAGYVDEDDKLEKADEAFMADAAATIVGAAVGTSTTTTYIESAAGIEEGGKTGLVAVTVGVLMLSGLFLAGLFKAIPQFAAACALVAIGAMMMRQAADIDWKNKEMALPAFLTIVMMPFTYSIAIGIAAGCISYVLIKMGMQKFDEVHPVMYGIAGFLILYYVGPGDGNTFQWIFSYIF
ncbi:MAG: guanine permease [Euryarchaeota archaeon]|nr:guanine permease [Euryarchaeota archaeon]